MGIFSRNSGKEQDERYAQEKIFCIGLNKTGTTSIESALRKLGYRLGDQVKAELLLHEYAKRNFRLIAEYCFTADAFQDAPFSFPFTFAAMDQFFPNAKFILSTRDTAEQWVDSLVNFHSKTFGNGNVPTREDLQNAPYRYKGFAWEVNRVVFNTPEDEPYQREALIRFYEHHNAGVREYFRMKNNFLEINVSQPGAYQEMCRFLKKEPKEQNFQWLNRT